MSYTQIGVAADWREQPVTNSSMFIPSGLGRIGGVLFDNIYSVLYGILLMAADSFILLNNLVWPNVKRGSAVPPAFSPRSPPNPFKMPTTWLLCLVARLLGKQAPDWLVRWTTWGGVGVGGDWGLTQAPRTTDSRGPCPALNALANHGILPRDGRHLTAPQISAALCRAYNLSPTISVQLIGPFMPFFEGRGWIDLEDIAGQGIVQHDGSVLREDINGPYAAATFIATQREPSTRLINLYFPASAKATPYTWKEHARILAHRRAVSREECGTFTLSTMQHLFGSGNASLTQIVVGGDLPTLRPWLGSGGYEYLVPGFEPKCLHRFGVSIIWAQLLLFLIEAAAGSLPRRRMVAMANDVQANHGYNPNLGKPGVDMSD